jgi:site-specific DNA-cytosine methylase
LGIDIGYKKLITTSNKEYIGIEKLQKVYNKLNKQKQGSINFKQTLKERNKLINESCNLLDLTEIGTIFIENLKNVKHKTKKNKSIYSKFMNKLQR